LTSGIAKDKTKEWRNYVSVQKIKKPQISNHH